MAISEVSGKLKLAKILFANMVKNAHKVLEVKNKNYVFLMHQLLLKHPFRTHLMLKVIQFLQFLSLIFGKISLKALSKLL